MTFTVANGFDVLTKGRARRSRSASSRTHRSPARGRANGGRRMALNYPALRNPRRLERPVISRTLER